MLLETTYTLPTGTATVVDGLAVGRNERGHDRAIDTFERAVSHANDVGLLSEGVDARTGELLGNLPQAFSHIGLVNAAWAIHEASSGPNVRRRVTDRPEPGRSPRRCRRAGARAGRARGR